MIRTSAVSIAASFVSLTLIGCVTPRLGGDRDTHGCIGSAGYAWCEAKAKCLRPWEEKCAESPVVLPPEPQSKAEPPFNPGPLPEGWKLEGVYPGIVQFVNPGSDASVAFIFFSAVKETPESMIRRAAADMGAKKGVIITWIFVADGTEAGLRFDDERIGSKRGRLRARCFPEQTPICVLTAGLWKTENEAQGLSDYETFLSWIRVDK